MSNKIASISDQMFFGCTSLVSITIPDNVTYIGDEAFSSCTSLVSIIIPDGVTEIGQLAFYNCTNLISVTLSEHLEAVRYGTFYKCCNLTSVIIPNSVSQIESYAFNDCTNLISLTIGNNVTYVGKALVPCPLKSIYCAPTTPPRADNQFSDTVLKECILYVPIGSKNAYESVDPWRNFWNIVEYQFSGIEDIGVDNEDIYDVYTFQGIIIGRHVYGKDLKNLPQGIYILKSPKRTLKVIL